MVSKLSWIEPDPPREPQSFWAENYPEMRSMDDNLAAAHSLGWTPVEHFHLPVEVWTRDYFGPLAERLHEFRAAHIGDADAEKVADMNEREIGLVNSYADYYSYAFYILRHEER